MSVYPYSQYVFSDSDDASLECEGLFPEMRVSGGVQAGTASGKSPSPVPSRFSPRPSHAVSPAPERRRFEGRNTVWVQTLPARVSIDAERLLTNLQRGFESFALKTESVFYDVILQAPPTEIGRLLRDRDEEKEALRAEHSAIQGYIRQNLDRLIREAMTSDHHTVVVSKNDSSLQHALRWVFSPNSESIERGTSTCYITRGELGRGGEAVVKEVIACSSNVFQRMAIRHLFPKEQKQLPAGLPTEAQPSRNQEQIEFVERLTRRGVPRLVPMRQWLYLGKDGSMKEGVAMSCYSSYYDVLMTDTEMTMSRKIRNAALLAETLYYFHQQGFVHRDLKLENILIDENQNPLLGDFGMTRRVGVPIGARGTVGYRPPEILEAAGERKLPADPRSDVWSFGVLLYISFLKTDPFEAIQTEHRDAVRSGDLVRRDRAFREFCEIVEREREKALTGEYSPMIDFELGPVIAGLLELNPANRMPEKTMLKILWQVAQRYESSL